MTQDQHGSGPARRAVLGAAAALGAGGAVFGLPGTADASTAPGTQDAGYRGGHGSYKLPVPTVIGHRGSSGYRPEHTFGSYQYALDIGADVIEQDLVPTKDGHLVCRHEPEIGGTTNVGSHPEFAGRKTTKTIDGVATTGWFTEDFTLAELKTLRAVERLPANRQRNTLYDGRWEIPTFEEVLQWADEQGRKRGRPVWLHSETKHPTYFRKLGLGLEERLAKQLRRYGRHKKNSPQFLESFEAGSLQRLGALGIAAPKIFLLSGPTSRPWDFTEAGDPRTVADLITPAGLKWTAGFAQGIGPTLTLIIPLDAAGKLGTPTTLVRDAHAAGLILHPYTMRNENSFLPADFRKGTDPNAYGDAFGAFKIYFEQGIDGIFSDNADTAVLARQDFLRP
ncbi:glycerophosphodiester phosphodiesterase [Streptomyces sp. H10-C2]|uniref:glycerophosphodiester phosphodiesterase n=1 Tax=unclassified Streptomyces TaxID=2593676 RepID=UPI0024B8D919|nr:MULTISPECIES: glycerophosphodiester phosphodiesterase [unclassified Streptomyces]MDJ0345021.1 glycerophosphodiester phosphodiesterase [Streptomyces sp. PH10-H1]MDJ0370798.1 glycerophosphodiester phosphodiesterase [Streptomyces sp. H10-C2]